VSLGPATHFPSFSFVSSNAAVPGVTVYRDDARVMYLGTPSSAWTGEWDDRTWSPDVRTFAIGPPFEE
jgi:hypothetical protein